jgi:hypothetical protein
MSKNNNVNTGQYKVAGRERPGQDIPEPERAKGVPSSGPGGHKAKRKRTGPSRSSSAKR